MCEIGRVEWEGALFRWTAGWIDTFIRSHFGGQDGQRILLWSVNHSGYTLPLKRMDIGETSPRIRIPLNHRSLGMVCLFRAPSTVGLGTYG